MASRIGARDVVATRRIEFTAVDLMGRGRDPGQLYVYICTLIARRFPIASLSGQVSG